MSVTQIFPTPSELALQVATQFCELAQNAIAARNKFSVALAGGSTPKAAYQLLATPQFADQIDWQKVHIFYGDERCVPPDHPDSNYHMSRQALLDHVPIPEANIYRMPGEIDPINAALQYEHQLRNFFWEMNYFDLVLLGMGADGHTASLFPGTQAIHEKNCWVRAHFVEKLNTWRITLTPVLINTAHQIVFVVAGQNKAEPLQQVRHGPYQPDNYPSQIIQPKKGQLTWMLDQAAASLISPRPE